MNLQRIAIFLHTETIESHLEKFLPPMAVELAAALLQIIYNVPIVRQQELPISLLFYINLQIVVVAIEIGRCDFDPFVHLMPYCLVLEPVMIGIKQILYILNHMKSPGSMSGGFVMFAELQEVFKRHPNVVGCAEPVLLEQG